MKINIFSSYKFEKYTNKMAIYCDEDRSFLENDKAIICCHKDTLVMIVIEVWLY